jgi:acetolactate synthase-1/2/3 large subunit
MRLADAIFQRIEQETDYTFFVPGGSCMFLVDALGRSEVKHISALSEQGAGAMALGYAMASGKLGVVLTISGAGAVNAMMPCLAAWSDSVPVLFISGQARTDTMNGNKQLRTQGLQPANIVPMVKPITKLSYQPETSGHDCMMALDKMITLCLSGRPGPCWLSVPQDLQASEV